VDEEALRAWELSKLRYYFAIAECSDVETAAAVYQEVGPGMMMMMMMMMMVMMKKKKMMMMMMVMMMMTTIPAPTQPRSRPRR
jgi:hypothetical protein